MNQIKINQLLNKFNKIKPQLKNYCSTSSLIWHCLM
nr:unnamed protein product [Callosobruchus chinensis]CAH7726294.1 unnamed protein product [Callosobruchus chinensis]